ncbi:kinase [Paenibacillus sp. CCS19]|uniref:N-acetylglucosamine kinase n=1 Tax=Paenibacillus sp. CCS19 TaxID=3158387 RepID=UPI00256BEF76|nr:BadF/BadG/BcrA/BcrD ATPase family protein [Paenibacillus cellulosilyticus]GMK42381.1 kinase [Paenibacillus cellulosilyticus]
MGYLLAIDQGGTKTVALIGDEQGRIVGIGYGGGACHQDVGIEMAMAMVKQACDGAFAQANITPSDVLLVLGGLTGADWDYEYTLLRDALVATLGIANIRVYNDCMIALRGGSDRKNAVVLCAGTAFNAAVIAQDGREVVYGFYINEEDMGGSALGKSVFFAVCNAHIGIAPPTMLTEAVLRYYGLPSVDELLHQGITRQLGPFKLLAPLLFETLRKGDGVARDLVERFGRSVSRYAAAGIRSLDLQDAKTDVVLSGSIFKAKDRTLQAVIAASIAESAPNAEVVDSLYEPVVGAYLMALDVQHGRTFPMRTAALLESAAAAKLLRLEQ